MAKSGPASQFSTLIADPAVDAEVEEAGWGDDDEEEDIEEKKKSEQVGGDGEAGWDVEDADLEIPDIGPAQGAAVTDSYVHLPTPGPPPPLNWTKNSQLVADHVMAGSFESACRLLHDQVRVFVLN